MRDPSAFPTLADPFASPARPVLAGVAGAVAAAHPLAVAAGQEMLNHGGSAVDAMVAAQAALCVVAPDACGLGGDMLCLVRAADGVTVAVNGAGAAPHKLAGPADDGGASVTVPGIVHAWATVVERWGRLPLASVLGPAIRLARGGMRVSPRLALAVRQQRARLERGGAGPWALASANAGSLVCQFELAGALSRIAKEGAQAFYDGELAASVAAAARARGGTLSVADLAAHRTVVAAPVETVWRGLRVLVQPPMSQGVLLAMALRGFGALGEVAADRLDHAAVELTNAAFAFRDRVGEGAALLDQPLRVDLARASRVAGPRAYLHTAGVAAADAYGNVASSLVSVFDDFGSGVFVREGGFVLNNRAGGFTAAPNEAGPGRRPVHTLAPVIVETPRGALALATPGADGQVQTLLQVLLATRVEGIDLAAALHRPRWRSEDGRLLVEAGHPGAAALRALGHEVVSVEAGHVKFGAVVCAGCLDDAPVCVADFRRETWAGVA